MSEDLEAELSDLTQFLYACPVGLVDFACDGAINLINPMAMQMMQGLGTQSFTLNFFSTLECCGPELRNLAETFSASRGMICDNHRIVISAGSVDGDVEPRVLACTLIKLSGERLLATLTDVSRQVAQERRLKQAENWFSTLLSRTEDFAVVSLDADGRIEDVKQAVLDQSGLTRAQVVGATLDVFDDPEPDDALPPTADLIALAQRDGWHLDQRWLRQADGGRRRCQRLIVVRIDAKGEGQGAVLGYTAVLRSVAGEGLDATKLQRLLRTDHLTGANNRAHFFEVAEREFRASLNTNRTIAVVAIDVDHFKSVNDTHGHGTGDEVLKAIAVTCAGSLRPGDTFARFGGEEFMVLLPGTDLGLAMAVAERLRAAVAALKLATPAGLPLRVTASFGCAALTPPVGTMTLLLDQADKALYAAKRDGRNRVGTFGTVAAVT